MTVERSSTNLTRYRGASIRAVNSQSKLSNIVFDGQGTENSRNASVGRLANKNQTAASIKVADYQSALGYLETRGVSHLAAKAMAAVLVDVAKSKGIGVMSLLESSSTALLLADAEAYNRINQLRDGTSQLSTSRLSVNTKSSKARLIKP